MEVQFSVLSHPCWKTNMEVKVVSWSHSQAKLVKLLWFDGFSFALN